MTDTAVRGWSLPTEGRASISETNAHELKQVRQFVPLGWRSTGEFTARPNDPFPPEPFDPHQYSIPLALAYSAATNRFR